MVRAGHRPEIHGCVSCQKFIQGRIQVGHSGDFSFHDAFGRALTTGLARPMLVQHEQSPLRTQPGPTEGADQPRETRHEGRRRLGLRVGARARCIRARAAVSALASADSARSSRVSNRGTPSRQRTRTSPASVQRGDTLRVSLKLTPLHLGRHRPILNFFRPLGKQLGPVRTCPPNLRAHAAVVGTRPDVTWCRLWLVSAGQGHFGAEVSWSPLPATAPRLARRRHLSGCPSRRRAVASHSG